MVFWLDDDGSSAFSGVDFQWYEDLLVHVVIFSVIAFISGRQFH
jgi:hypothetical protein